jgi:hypothetical protein
MEDLEDLAHVHWVGESTVSTVVCNEYTGIVHALSLNPCSARHATARFRLSPYRAITFTKVLA